jgi:KipI family sensor histidine kinase inhibitor
MNAPPVPSLQPLGDSAWLLCWPERIDPAINDAVHACAQQLRSGGLPPWLEALVPGYASLALLLDLDAFGGTGPPLAIARAWIEQRLQASPASPAVAAPRIVEIPVRYGGSDGPDLEAVAQATGLAADEVVARHARVDYRVALIGFAPGFPYLLGLDPTLAVPRHSTPRTLVPAGSVAIGGAQTGIYPQAGPGGWQLIGRTRARLFDPSADPPTLLAAGDRLRFVPERGR